MRSFTRIRFWQLAAALALAATCETARADDAHRVAPPQTGASGASATTPAATTAAPPTAVPPATATTATAPAIAEPTGDRLLPEGTFLSSDGRVRPLAETLAAGRRPYRREKYFLRAAAEMLGLIAIGEAYYWIAPEINKKDWDFPDGKTRLSNLTPSFDTNLHVTNDILHPLSAGSMYYWFARVNGMTPLEALLYSGTASASFEFVFEWLERASINDLIMTPMAGFSPGELWTHMGDYFGSAPRKRFHTEALSWTLGIPNRLHRQKGFSIADQMPEDNLGFSSFYTHRFEVLLGGSKISNDLNRNADMFDLFLRAEIVSIPGYLQPGTFSTSFSDGEFVEGKLHMSFGKNAQQTYDLFFSAKPVGYYEQDIGIENGERVGRAWSIALDSSYDFAELHRLSRYDAWALAHLAGPALNVWGVRGDMVARFEAAAHPDFAVIQSLAWRDWSTAYGTEGAKSELIEQGYYFALGVAARARASLEWKGIQLAGRAQYGTYGSIDRWDRFQDKVTRDVHQTDQIGMFEASVGFTIPNSPLHLRAYAEHVGHASNMRPSEQRAWDRRYGMLFGAQF